MKLALICLLVINLVVVADCRWVWLSPDPARRDVIGPLHEKRAMKTTNKIACEKLISACNPPTACCALPQYFIAEIPDLECRLMYKTFFNTHCPGKKIRAY